MPKTARTPDAPIQLVSDTEARAKLARLSRNLKQLWVVVHVRAHKQLRADGSVDEPRVIATAVENAAAVVEGGADAILLINSRCEMPLYERVIAAVRARFPKFPLGISALSYGPENLIEGYRLAKRFDAQIVWMEVVPGNEFEYEEDEGRYVRAPVTPRSLAREVAQRDKPDAMLVAGVHMKYTRPLDGRSFADSMRFSLGAADGYNITGPQTAVLADLERIRLARELAGRYPVGLASGVSLENIAAVIESVDYVIVGTSLKDPADPLRTSLARVRALRQKMDELGGGPPR